MPTQPVVAARTSNEILSPRTVQLALYMHASPSALQNAVISPMQGFTVRRMNEQTSIAQYMVHA